MAAPMIPGLNDSELEAILVAARESGAIEAGYVALRLPREIETLFQEWLNAHAPDRAAKVMSLVRGMHGGRAYDPTWSHRQKGSGPYALMLRQRFDNACARIGLNIAKLSLDETQFRPPKTPGRQLHLFDD